MALTVVPVSDETAEVWREIHNQIVPAAPLSAADVEERRGRNLLTLGVVDGHVVGNATVRPVVDGQATVIVRVRPDHRRRGYGTEYLAHLLAVADELGATTVATVVLAANADGLTFARRHGFAEVERYEVDGAEFIDLARDLPIT
ncbi:GNAT family N-acetyltransferase [Dactylosporangium sp. NPDC051541]|uniref:GNAT family N-acetyltransferase n=1 Tax=Dactylosporangium sp. NPDC051541 TaxID=3363977 RepID=UPI00379874CC